MKRIPLPSIDPAVSRRLILDKCGKRNGTGRIARERRTISSSEVQKWASLLIDQYGDDAADLAEVSVIEMLATKNGMALIAWAHIFAAIQQMQKSESERC